MVADAEVARPSSLPVVDARYCSSAAAGSHVRELMKVTSPPPAPSVEKIQVSESVPVELSAAHRAEANKPAGATAVEVPESPGRGFVPRIRSGSFSAIGPRRNMEDEHIQIDDLSKHLGPPFRFPQPSSFYGVFDGHGGPEAAAYVKENIVKLVFEEAEFPTSAEVDKSFIAEVMSSTERAYLAADKALADDSGVSRSTGTTALTAFIFGRLLMVANAGDCRAVLCRKGVALDMSQDHRPSNPFEKRRVEKLGAYIEDGYLNGILSVTRALGDWDVKLYSGSAAPSPLVPDPEIRHLVLTEDDEFLILGCDGIWDAMSSQHAVNVVRRVLRKHDDPEQCARDLVKESLRLGAHDNLTVVVVCLLGPEHRAVASPPPSRQRKMRFFGLSSEALCSFRGLLDGGGSR